MAATATRPVVMADSGSLPARPGPGAGLLVTRQPRLLPPGPRPGADWDGRAQALLDLLTAARAERPRSRRGDTRRGASRRSRRRCRRHRDLGPGWPAGWSPYWYLLARVRPACR